MPDFNPTSVFRKVRQRLLRIAGHSVLFPAIAVVLVAVIWGAALVLIRAEYEAARQAAATAAMDQGSIYEEKVLRRLREQDQLLKLMKYAYQLRGAEAALADLRTTGLLPPKIRFTTGFANTRGEVIASTHPLETISLTTGDYARIERYPDRLHLSPPRQNPVSGEWTLLMSRAITSTEGTFTGVAFISVNAAYPVSGYEESKLGREGILGIAGTDGEFRVKRSGDEVSFGGHVDYAPVMVHPGSTAKEAKLSVNGWDGVKRYTSARELYGFSLVIVVGLSEQEQLKNAAGPVRQYVRQAVAGSVLLALVVALLWRLTYQLTRSRDREVAAQVAHAQEVEHLAYHDSLTGLPNRGMFSEILTRNISRVQRYNGKLAVLFLDLDRFKLINDTLGHDAGDHLLREVAQRLTGCLRESDTVARLGGDEFVVMLPEVTEESAVSAVAWKIIGAIAKPIDLLGREFRITVSIGISLCPQDGQDEQTLKKNADIAMYLAKEKGKNTFQFYSEKLHTESLERLTLESSLRHALERDEFYLHYQAKRDVHSDGITGMEVLLRWRHPDLGTVAPMKFIPVLEETGLIIPVGKWVLKTACTQSVAWRQRGLPCLTMAVNLTPTQFFHPELPEVISTTLAETGMEANLLELEITESLLMRDLPRSLQVMNKLKEIGVRIAIDDFGIGYSSLSTLKQFPLDTVKVDRAIVRDVTKIAEDRALTDAIVSMGRSLSLKVVAQGVETREQADFFRDHACDEMQGFYFNKPVPADEFEQLFRK